MGNPYVYGGMYSATVIGQGDDCSGDAGWGLQALTLGPQNIPMDDNGTWLRSCNTESWDYDYNTNTPAPPGSVGPFGTISVGDDLSLVPDDAIAIVNIMHRGGGENSHMNLVLCATGMIIESNGGPTTYTDASKGQDGTGSCSNGTGGNPSDAALWTDHWYLPGPILNVAPPTILYPDVSNNQWNSNQELFDFLGACKAMPSIGGVVHKCTQGSDMQDAYWLPFKGWCSDPANDMSWVGYHYVDQSDPGAQATNFINAQGGQWVMLDFEADSGDMNNFWAVTQAFNDAGVSVSMAYIPHWYWGQIGNPNLATLTANQIALVSSAYPAGGGDPSVSYSQAGGNNGEGWAPYGGCMPTAWQFTNAATIGNKTVDCNAYNGLGPNLNALFTGAIFQAS
jgi:hypothetical protein